MAKKTFIFCLETLNVLEIASCIECRNKIAQKVAISCVEIESVYTWWLLCCTNLDDGEKRYVVEYEPNTPSATTFV